MTVYAEQLAAAVGAEVIRMEMFNPAETPDLGEPVHVTFTDHLFGSTPDEAVRAVLNYIADRPLSLSLHDIPQPQEGYERCVKRRAAYEKLAAAATLVTVNSHSEAAFFDGTATDPLIIRLPIPRIDSPFRPEPGTVGILGFIYPGKGHEDLIAALTGTGYRLRFLGGVSTGHEEWARSLARHADITGWLTDEELAEQAGRIEVPVCAHRHYSASGSLMTWLGAGRNVLASDSPYTREIAAWLPGRITLVQPGQWQDAIAAFNPRQMDPPNYDWADVAEQWRSAWMQAGLI